MNTISKYRKTQKTFGKLFLVSFGVCIFTSIFIGGSFMLSLKSKSSDKIASSNSSAPAANPTISGTTSANSNRKDTPTRTPQTAQTPVQASNEVGSTLLFTFLFITGGLSLFATVFTFLGFLTMTIFAWSKERREKESFRLEKEKKEIEIEKLKIELDKSKNTNPSMIKKCNVCNRIYPDVSLNFCLDDGARLSESFNSEEFQQNPSQKTLIRESNLPTEKIEYKTKENENRTTS